MFPFNLKKCHQQSPQTDSTTSPSENHTYTHPLFTFLAFSTTNLCQKTALSHFLLELLLQSSKHLPHCHQDQTTSQWVPCCLNLWVPLCPFHLHQIFIPFTLASHPPLLASCPVAWGFLPLLPASSTVSRRFPPSTSKSFSPSGRPKRYSKSLLASRTVQLICGSLMLKTFFY